MNIIDVFILLYLAVFLLLGFYRGFFRQALDLLVLIISFALAFTFFDEIGRLIATQTNIALSFANVLGFFVVWFAVEVAYYIIFVFYYDKLPKKIINSKLNRFFGVAPAFLRGLITVWVLVALVSILPLTEGIQKSINGSFFASRFKNSSKIVEKYIGNVFSQAIDETISFLTVKPQSDEKVDLNFTVSNGTADRFSETKMLELVNRERTSRGLKPLVMDNKLQEVARAHSRDMFAKGYFAHNNLEGQSPFDRMDKAGIRYLLAGENLALAPTVDLAHQGLMNSPGHKANILTGDFGKVGIGVIDGGKYGKMFSQEFTD